jgi:hypothetical protein
LIGMTEKVADDSLAPHGNTSIGGFTCYIHLSHPVGWVTAPSAEAAMELRRAFGPSSQRVDRRDLRNVAIPAALLTAHSMELADKSLLQV